MNSITIKRPVAIKVKVTEGFKRKLAQELQEHLHRVEAELQHLEFQSKRMISELEKVNPQGIPAARQHLENQNRKLTQTRAELMEKIKEVGKLPIGSEILHGTVESITDVKIGDDWSDILGVEILVQDEKIIDIRCVN